jgi:predicted RNase H-like HicB family nuclease
MTQETKGDVQMQRFTVIIEHDPESGWLVGEVVELPGCYTQAPTLSELETNIKEAIQAYLEVDGVPELAPSFVGVHQVEVAAWVA